MAGLPGGAGVDVPAAARGGGLRGRDARLQRPQELHGAQGRPLRLQPLLQAATQGNCQRGEIPYMMCARGSKNSGHHLWTPPYCYTELEWST